MICITEPRIPIVRRGEGYFLRWYYNGWHYWLFYPGKINFITEGEKYRTLGTQQLTIGSGQITQEQCDAIRTIMNATEIYIYTDSGWGVVRIDPGSWIVYDHGLNRYEAEINVIIGSRNISSSGFSPVITVPELPPTIYVPTCGEIIIGSQVWMACNYNIDFPGSKVYNNDESNRAIYGGLYSHSQIMTPGFCPYGWHVPTEDEWDDLIDYVGDLTDAGGILKEIGTTHWLAPNTGATDDFDFSALPGGFFFLGFNDVGETAYFWSTKTSSYLFITGQAFRLKNDSAGISKHQLASGYFCSVRLIKDSAIITDDLITDLVATAISDTEIDLSWVNHYAGATNNVIEYSTDGINYSVLDTVAAGDTTYSVTGLTTNVQYYFRIYFTVGSVYSLPSNVSSDYCAMNIPLYANGTGLSVGRIRFEVTGSDVDMTIDGTGKFYDDTGGTVNEGTTRTITAGALRTFYLRVPSGTCKILLFAKGNLIGWGNTSLDGMDTITTYLNAPRTNMNVSAMPSTLQTIHADTCGAFAGNISNIPSSCTWFSASWLGSVSCSLSGNLNTLPSGMTSFFVGNGNTITGSIETMPTGIAALGVRGTNTISGNISNLTTPLYYLYVTGSNTLTGDIGDLSASANTLICEGSNTLSGSLNDLGNSFIAINVRGNNTFSGTLAGISGMSSLSQFIVYGSNTISGNISDIPNNVDGFYCQGGNTITGDVADLPSGLSYFFLYGSNTVSGDCADLPNLVLLDLRGSNTLTGDISGFPNIPDITVLGANTISGDLGNKPANTVHLYIGGNCQIDTYTGGSSWPANFEYLILLPAATYGLSSAEVDNVLIDLATITWGGTSKRLQLDGNNAARTAASDAARLSLIAQGVTVVTN